MEPNNNLNNIPPSQIQPPVVSGKSKTKIILIGIILIVVIIVGIVFAFSSKKSTTQNKQSATTLTTQVSNTLQESSGFNDSDLRISATRISDTINSAYAFSAIKSDAISKVDQDFLTKYFGNYSSKNLPPINQSQKILTTYSNLLSIFDANVSKQYQCLFESGDTCSLQSLINIGNLASLRALTLFQQNKSSQAQSAASSIVNFGKNVTANADSVITLLVGWSVQNLGYNILATVQPKGAISSSDKSTLIANLRNEQKKVLQYMYTAVAKEIDYITSPNNKPSRPLDADEEDLINTYRKGAATTPTAWNPNETKKYYYDSYKIALSNVDLACGATPATSKMDLNFNPQDEQTENYVGKTLYSTGYASLDTLSQKRCAVETLIQNL